jgi:hypothetical protein
MQNFSVTGIPPYHLDYATRFPVLAINISYVHTTDIKARLINGRLTSDSYSTAIPRSVYAKQTSFLVADRDFKFKWVSQGKSSYYRPELAQLDPRRGNLNSARFTLNKDIGDRKNMLYPVRAFSITGISMDGFDPEKAYPVLAIDMDQYIPETPENEEGDLADRQSQSIAFFLVGDDSGEFAWIAEDECRLFPLD